MELHKTHTWAPHKVDLTRSKGRLSMKIAQDMAGIVSDLVARSDAGHRHDLTYLHGSVVVIAAAQTRIKTICGGNIPESVRSIIEKADSELVGLIQREEEHIA